MMNNRWFQLVASVISMIMIANLQYSWTLFVEPLRMGTGWALSDIGFAFTLFVLFQTFVQPLDGWMIDRLGPRWFISAAGVLCGLGWAGMGYATTLPQLYALYCMAGMGAAFVYSGSIGSAMKWFKDRRGLASGIIAAGFGGGAALFIPIISSLIQSGGYQSAFVATGIVQGLVIVVVAQFLRHPALTAEGAKPPVAVAAGSQLGTRHFTTGEMLRTPQFYTMYAAFVLMASGGLMVTAQAGPISRAWGYTASVLTLVVFLNPIANAAARVFWGWISDKIGRETTMILTFVLQAASFFLVLSLGQFSSTWFVITLVLVNFTWGEIYSIFPSTVGDYFGTRHATSNYAVLYTAKGLGSIFGGGVGAILIEQFGTWSVGFYASAIMALVAAGLAVKLKTSTAPSRMAVGVPVAAK